MTEQPTVPSPGFPLITTLAELDTLAWSEVYDGYRSYEQGDPAPGANHSLGFVHGWRCAYWDAHPHEIPDQHRLLAKALTRRLTGAPAQIANLLGQ